MQFGRIPLFPEIGNIAKLQVRHSGWLFYRFVLCDLSVSVSDDTKIS
ncbi:hypothetical protein [Desulfonema magnum]|uniref:Uncharacterized protein n=1 Tax=Desulfonema magnum TaxID=45655 RepID=A0A975GTT5_9BACT|nr:hypothetical protein [Desulfonema magnum]QTA93327.1 Uncharacterized protein dnm_094290 [Desulfonema magnum]